MFYAVVNQLPGPQDSSSILRAPMILTPSHEPEMFDLTESWSTQVIKNNGSEISISLGEAAGQDVVQ